MKNRFGQSESPGAIEQSGFSKGVLSRGFGLGAMTSMNVSFPDTQGLASAGRGKGLGLCQRAAPNNRLVRHEVVEVSVMPIYGTSPAVLPAVSSQDVRHWERWGAKLLGQWNLIR